MKKPSEDVEKMLTNSLEIIDRLVWDKWTKPDPWIPYLPKFTPEELAELELLKKKQNRWYRRLWRKVSRLKQLRIVFIDNYTHNDYIE